MLGRMDRWWMGGWVDGWVNGCMDEYQNGTDSQTDSHSPVPLCIQYILLSRYVWLQNQQESLTSRWRRGAHRCAAWAAAVVRHQVIFTKSERQTLKKLLIT